jgi:hypothetical protein
VTSDKARRRLRRHAVTVLVLVLAYAVMAAAFLYGPGAGPTSGVGLMLPLLPLTVLGLPWAIPFWADPYAFDGIGHAGHHLILVGPAILNVLIHAAIHRVRAARAVKSDAR